MKKRLPFCILTVLVTSLILISPCMAGQGIVPAHPFFEQLKAQFTQSGQAVTIPVTLRTIDNTATVSIIGINGLPGAQLTNVTSEPGYASATIVWTAPASGTHVTYDCTVSAMSVDTTSNQYFTNGTFTVHVNNTVTTEAANIAPIPFPLEAQEGGLFKIPVQATRKQAPVGDAANLKIAVTGLQKFALEDYYSTPKLMSTNLTIETVAEEPGLYLVQLQIFDEALGNEAYTLTQLPVKVKPRTE